MTRYAVVLVSGAAALAICMPAGPGLPVAHADNKRLNNSVVTNVYTVQKQAGCPTDIVVNPQLRLAAQWHALDLRDNDTPDADTGSDGSTPQDRAAAAGFHGRVAETVVINQALAVNGIDIMSRWFADPAALAIMRDCSNTAIGVWSENALNRSVVVAVYG
jgi:uncharacterized protein YkwD